jgi:glycosyltransferase involved in cell wall biosynthesis
MPPLSGLKTRAPETQRSPLNPIEPDYAMNADFLTPLARPTRLHLGFFRMFSGTSMTKPSFVFFAAVGYEHCLSGRTRRLADVLAAMGYEVSFVEMPSLRAAAGRLSRPGRAGAASGVRVVHLPPLPGYMPLSETLLATAWVRWTQRQLLRRIPGLADATLVVSTPWWLPVLRDLPRTALCYDYIDHLSVHAGVRHAGKMAAWDEELIDSSDLLTTVSDTLREALAKRTGPDRIVLIPNGVERRWIENHIDPIPRPAITGGKDRPIVGFLGALFEWIDVDLLADTAAAMPDALFAFVGPTRFGVSIERLAKLDNVRCFPAQPYSDVPRWIKAFDVCLIPFKQDIVSTSADPIKLYEYLALGKPVVGTLPFGTADDPAPMYVGRDAGEFVQCIWSALKSPEAQQPQRILYAARHTWERRAADLVTALRSSAPVGA